MEQLYNISEILISYLLVYDGDIVQFLLAARIVVLLQ